MNRSMPVWIGAGLAALLSACGGGGTATPLVVAIGNSITIAPPTPSVQWAGNWGMAVSAPSLDYAHTVAAGLGANLIAANMVPLERDPTGRRDLIAGAAANVTADALAIVELGDNVPADQAANFVPAYVALLDAVAPARRLVCVATWWLEKPALDAQLRAACLAHGGRWVEIHDLKTDPRNVAENGTYSNPAVDAHPHAWAMSQIAARIEAAAQ